MTKDSLNDETFLTLKYSRKTVTAEETTDGQALARIQKRAGAGETTGLDPATVQDTRVTPCAQAARTPAARPTRLGGPSRRP